MWQGIRRTSLSFLSLSVLFFAGISAPAQAVQCVTFAGLEHCPAGAASLTTNDDGSLSVGNLGSQGSDGVTISLDEATTWVASLGGSPDDSGDATFSTVARADGQDISRADLQAGGDEGTRLSASFTGGTGKYSVLVYQAGQLVASQGGLDAERFIHFGDLEDFIMWLISIWTFQNRMADGSCGWMIELTQDVAMQLPDGTNVTGDEIHLIEEVAKGGHYPYLSFDEIKLTGNLSSIQLRDETVYP